MEQREENEQVKDLDLRKEEANTEPSEQENQSSLHTEHEENDRSTTVSEQKHVQEVETSPKRTVDDSKNASAQVGFLNWVIYIYCSLKKQWEN